MIKQVPAALLDFLAAHDTFTVSNAIKTFNVRLRNEGYAQSGVRCLFPNWPSLTGYAITGRIRTSAPSISSLCYYHRMDWWNHVVEYPDPKIIVLGDVDRIPGVGAFVGEIHAHIAKALGCVSHLSNGTVRDASALEKPGFQCFSVRLSVSHSYAHMVDFGEPVDMGGLRIYEGDLLHGDFHGIQIIPFEVASELPDAVTAILKRKSELIQFCQQPDFPISRLTAMLNDRNPRCQPPTRP